MLPYSPSTVAEAIATLLDVATAARGYATLAIPGGRSPGPVLTELARVMSPFVRNRLHLLWLDERAVAVGAPERNDAPTLAAWQAGGALPAHVHVMPADVDDLDVAAEAYAATLAAATRGGRLDVSLVGIGEDGHFASLFPNHSGLNELATVFAVTDSPKPPARRLTLGLGPISHSEHVVILALGAAKGEVARRAWLGPNRNLPVSLLPKRSSVWYLDDEAAAVARR